MRVSQFFLSTLKEAPAEAELASHRLMLRAGMIKRLAAGIYTWMPLGLRVLRRVEAIVREEMNRAGAIELLMPVIQPGELWQESGRWDKYGPDLLRIKDRHQRDFVVQPTSEEVITDIARRELKSYKQLPVNLYHIQTKFRDEVRPRFGVMRSREFIMKDAYSFDADKTAMLRSYQAMYDAYMRIFTRLGLKFRPVRADTGQIGGSASHEFQVLADSGEDAIAYCPDSDYAANVELAEAAPPAAKARRQRKRMQKVRDAGQIDLRAGGRIAAAAAVAHGQVHHALGRRQGADAAHPRRSHAQRNQDRQSRRARGFRWASDAEIEAATGCKPGLSRTGGHSRFDAADRRSRRRRDGRFRLRRKRSRLPLARGEFWPRLPRARSRRRPAQRGGRRCFAGRQGHALDRPRHRSRSCLRPWRRVFESAWRNFSRRCRSTADHGNGLLWHRHHAGRRGGDRTESRRARHRVARPARAVPGRDCTDRPGSQRRRARTGRTAAR